MRLPYDLLSQSYKKPDIYLCDVDKTPMCKLNATGAKGSFKLNAYSELSFETSRTYLDTITGETRINPFYDKIETPRLIKLDGFGYFEIQGPDMSSNGIKESQTVTAYSLEYTLSTKYLENFQINTGAAESVEVGYAYDTYYEEYGDDYINYIAPVTLYNEKNHKLSLLNLAIEKAYGWKINYVDDSLKTLSRKFEVDRQSIYDFLMNEVCAKFNCYIIFDTENNEINVYAESKTSKFIGDGKTNQFTISPKFDAINTVSVDGYKTTKWSYNASTGVITLEDTPESGAHIEIIDGALTEWETDVFVTFENLAQEIQVSYDSDEIKTQLTVTYGEDLDIREANLGIPYLTDLSYYYTVDWMGQDLYDAYTAYMQKSQNSQAEYKKNAEAMLDVANRQSFEEMRLSMGYGEASVLPTTVGTYYVRGGSAPNYYYTEVSLPADYDASIQYYKLNGTNINTGKVRKLEEALQKYLNDGTLDDFIADPEDDSDLTDEFSFMVTYKISDLYNDLSAATTKEDKESAINKFFDEMWNEVGRTPLKKSYKEPYEKQQTQFIDYAKEDHENYSYYYITVLILDSINKAIDIRNKNIEQLEKEYQDIQKLNADISTGLTMDQNFTEDQLIRLSAFIREDELQLDDIVETDEDTIADSFKIKEDAIESGRIELHKLSQPKLQFSMTMANIYAIKDFEPIIDQFQLGNVIKVGLRKDYIKQSRLLQVDLEFDNLASLSTEFGELTNLRTQSDIHADLLGQAISAGKSVAENSANWTKGSDTATNTDLRIQNGLLDAATVLKSIDGTQGVEMGKYGIKMTKVNSAGEIDPKQGWIVNNMFAYTDNNWKTTKTVLGEFKLRSEENSRWGLLADAVIAGYVEGSQIIGGDIKIGNIITNSFPFQVNTDGDMVATSATIKGDSTIAGWNVTDKYIDSTVSDTKKRLYLASASDESNNWICATDSNGKNTFYVAKDGKVYATSGEIGGFTLGDKAIYKTKTSYDSDTDGVYLGTDGIGLGKKKFYVTSDGALTATDATITGTITGSDIIGGTINIGDGTFKVDDKGNVVMKAASIDGYATDGELSSAISVTEDKIDIIAEELSLKGKTINLTSDNITISSTNFSVTKDGSITAKDGTIGGWSIGSDIISGKNGNYEARMNKAAIGTSGSVVFGVYDGSKWSAYIDGQGKMVAQSGSIGGWNLTSSYIDSTVSDSKKRLYLASASDSSSNWIGTIDADGTTTFSVSKAGQLYAKGGTFDTCTISNCTIDTASIPNLSASKITSGTMSANRISGGTIDASKITVTNLSASSITGGTLTIDNGLSVKTSGGAYLESVDNGIRIYSGSRDPYFTVTTSSIYLSANSTQFYIRTSNDSAANRVNIYSPSGIKIQTKTNGYLNGTWYLDSSVAITSDENKKNTIIEISDSYEKFFDDIGCYTFKYNDGKSDRLHCGFIAQKIHQSLNNAEIDSKDFGGIVTKHNDDGTEDWYIRYEEFIPLNTWQIQKLKTRVAELESRLAALEERN